MWLRLQMGDKKLSDRVAEDLSKSALIKNRIIQNENVSKEADLIVLSLDLPHNIAERSKQQDQAETRLGTILKQLKQNNDTQGLIVLTPGTLKRPNEHTDQCIARAFSTIVNAQGRVGRFLPTHHCAEAGLSGVNECRSGLFLVR